MHVVSSSVSLQSSAMCVLGGGSGRRESYSGFSKTVVPPSLRGKKNKTKENRFLNSR